jgi:hypothetical protein
MGQIGLRLPLRLSWDEPAKSRSMLLAGSSPGNLQFQNVKIVMND